MPQRRNTARIVRLENTGRQVIDSFKLLHDFYTRLDLLLNLVFLSLPEVRTLHFQVASQFGCTEEQGDRSECVYAEKAAYLNILS